MTRGTRSRVERQLSFCQATLRAIPNAWDHHRPRANGHVQPEGPDHQRHHKEAIGEKRKNSSEAGETATLPETYRRPSPRPGHDDHHT